MGVTALYDVLKAKIDDATKRAILDSYDTVLGLKLLEKADEIRAEQAKIEEKKKQNEGFLITGEGDHVIDAFVLARAVAKRDKRFEEADRIRDELRAQGIEITDTKDGAIWRHVD